MLRFFVDPGPFFREKVEFAAHGASHDGHAKFLVPLALVDADRLHGLLLIVHVAEVWPDGLFYVWGFALEHGAADRLCVCCDEQGGCRQKDLFHFK